MTSPKMKPPSLTPVQRRLVSRLDHGEVLCAGFEDSRLRYFLDGGVPVNGRTAASLLRKAIILPNDDALLGDRPQTYRLADVEDL